MAHGKWLMAQGGPSIYSLPLAISHQPSAMTGLYRFNESHPLAFADDSRGPKAVRFERLRRLARRHERRPALRARQNRADAAARRRADNHDAAAGAQHARDLAH